MMMTKILLILVSILSILNLHSSTPTLQLSGFFNVNQTTGANLFYLFYESQSSPSTDPLILWLSGGPGCSSLMASFFENGMYFVNENLTTYENPYAWNTFANIIYVDSPVGSGFSYVENQDGYSHTETEVSENLYSLLTQFYVAYPKYSQLELYIIGESYAGHYVPSISYYIYTKNQNTLQNTFINLKGLGVGNAMVDPLVQYGSLGLYAYTHGIIDYLQYKETTGLYDSCIQAINSGDYNMTNTICNQILSVIQEYGGNFNPYDVTKTCPPDLPLCYNFTSIESYLDLPAIKAQLGVSPNATWNLCSSIAYTEIIHDWFNSPIDYIPTLLENYKVLVYNGADGWICNFIGSEEWVHGLNWPYQTEFNNSPRTIFMEGETIAGYYQSYDNLSMFVINNAGHMAPHDQPKVTLDMLSQLLDI